MSMNIKIMVALPILALALMGQACVAQDVQVRNVLNTMCPAVDVAYAHYQAVSSLVSSRTQGRVELAKQQADLLCAGRATATTVTVLATGAVVYASVRDALREARASGGGVAYQGDLDKLEGMLNKARRELR
jgi:hypothetical protein